MGPAYNAIHLGRVLRRRGRQGTCLMHDFHTRLLCAVLPGVTLTGLTDCTAFLGCRQQTLPAGTLRWEAFALLHHSGCCVPGDKQPELTVIGIVELHSNEAVIHEILGDVGLYHAGC